MNFNFDTIQASLRENPTAEINRWEENYLSQIRDAAGQVLKNRENSPVVLLAGPSGSSKTSTGARLRDEIIARGVPAHLISMDNYYVDWEEPGFPRTPEGERDLESPRCLNIPLLNQHFSQLETGVDIHVPIYDFPTHKPLEGKSIPMSPAQGDVFIFEGIHALNPLFTQQHPQAFRLYVSPAASFVEGDRVICHPILLRLMRRVVRDAQFRGAPAEFSLSLWGNVISSEKIYIEPYRASAHAIINTTLGYELGVLKDYVLRQFSDLAQNVPCRDMVDEILRLLQRVDPIPSDLVPQNSILREFIG